ncbi:uncharacterized protein N7515_010017 [Penicillium bovifimosum]|uniref:Uncharacterized protein n=1 Tax=Penicillium bovifimosum TaxID=126998 RepID=A0A9W9GIT2_9EURO|nr:uncharacterized protein N7515_010017 [Penicillium bovifimosum]KAJ5120629.1 hypothetical protein N7515_010017 [Penicillium bovifimosum]
MGLEVIKDEDWYLHICETNIILFNTETGTYDHRVWKTGLPVRSAVLKPIIVRGQFSMRPEL